MLGGQDINILSAFQITKEIPHDFFEKEGGMKFDVIYSELIKKLFDKLSLEEYKKVKIVIDARKHKGGQLGKKIFINDIETFLKEKFSKTNCTFKMIPSYLDILVELVDFVSNTFYKEYQSDSKHVFEQLGFRLVQIKNPL